MKKNNANMRVKTATVNFNGTTVMVTTAIFKNITRWIRKFRRTENPGDFILDLSPLRDYRGLFTLIKPPSMAIDHSKVIDDLRVQDGILRLRMGEILTFRISKTCCLMIRNHEKNGSGWISYEVLNSDEIPIEIIHEAIRSKSERRNIFNKHKKRQQNLDSNQDFLSRKFEEEWIPSEA